MLDQPFVQALVALVVSPLLSAWLAAKFALNRYRHEKIWERKTAAYTVIFENLHEMRSWFEAHLIADREGLNFSDSYSNKLVDAKNELGRRIAGESWIIPSAFVSRTDKLLSDLALREVSWLDHLAAGHNLIADAEHDLKEMTINDLGIQFESRLRQMLGNLRRRAHPVR